MKHELLAPAGNLEAGYAALYYGADAVYLGLTKFSARAGAENFTAEELDEFTAYAHSLHRKVFVTLNTILTEAEINELPPIIQALKKAKVDALIIQDLGVFYLLKRLAPEIELHASTQMAVHNAEGAKFLRNLGFKRVVLARELTLSEIKKIAKEVPDVDLEVFVHGALCYSYSGQCLFSALEYGKSANRGRCVYPCRALYTEQNSGNTIETLKGHLFSMKDLALEEQISDIPALSFKIEGRKKSPLYVAAVTNYYRHILDGKKKNMTEAEDIKQIFSRPWCKFHFNGKAKDVTDEQFVGHRGLLIGKVENVRGQRLTFKTARDIARYDGIQVDSGSDEKPFGFAVKSLFVNRKPVFEAKAGQVVEIELPEEHPHLSLNAPVYLASASAVKGKYNYTKPKAGEFKNFALLSLRVEINATEIWAMSGQTAVKVGGDFTPAKDVSKTEAAVYNAFAKTLDAGIKFNDIEISNPDKRFAPVSLLNELRRQLVEELLATGAADEALPVLPTIKPYIRNGEQGTALKVVPLSLRTEVRDFSAEDYRNAWFQLPQICRDVAKLSAIVRDIYAAGARKFLVENYYGFEMLKAYPDIEIGAGSFLYVMNRYAAAELKELGAKFATLALESSADNMAEVIKNAPLPMVQITFARPPLFTSAVCIRRNDCAHCKRLDKQWLLKSGGHEYIAVSKDCQLQLFDKEPYERAPIAGAYAYI